ncbi:MAG: ABC transporter ATP-binding protein [Proteobacteria bacterium]|nr:ABC transporter ATP-binding protein [Pseudomonadota bacterium]
MSRLEVSVMRKRHPGANADTIAGLEFKLDSGDFVAIVGPSGSGKTTLLKIIAGLDAEFSGRVSCGQDTRVGFVFQEPRLLPWLTVADNLRLVLPDLARRTLDEALTRVGLAGSAQQFPLHLSGGMQRRVALLRAFLIKPELLLLDEPFISLDVPTAESLYTLLADLRRNVMPTTVLVTHDLHEALALADRLLFISRSPAQVILDYPVRLAKPRRREDDCIDRVHRELMSQHPELLAGLSTVQTNREAA